MNGFDPEHIYWDPVPFVGWPLVGAVLALFAAVLVALLARYFSDRRSREAHAKQVLAERLARGEIDADEYHARKLALTKTTEPVPGARTVGIERSAHRAARVPSRPRQTHRPR